MRWIRSDYVPETNSTTFYNQTTLKQIRLDQNRNFSKNVQKISQIDQIQWFDLLKKRAQIIYPALIPIVSEWIQSKYNNYDQI